MRLHVQIVAFYLLSMVENQIWQGSPRSGFFGGSQEEVLDCSPKLIIGSIIETFLSCSIIYSDALIRIL